MREGGDEMGGVNWTDQLGTSHRTEVRSGGRFALERIYLGTGGMP